MGVLIFGVILVGWQTLDFTLDVIRRAHCGCSVQLLIETINTDHKRRASISFAILGSNAPPASRISRAIILLLGKFGLPGRFPAM